MFKKTVYKKDIYRPTFKSPVLYVGFNLTNQKPWLHETSVLAGFDSAIFIDTASDAKDFLAKPDTIANMCIVNARYTYSDKSSDSIPIKEIPFCTLDGLSYYQKRIRPVNGFFQGFQFIRQIAQQYDDIDFAVYGAPYDGIPSQAKEMNVDFIPALSDNVYVPFTIMEYLRNKNVDLFAGGSK